MNWRVTWGQLSTFWIARVNSSGAVLDPGSVAVAGVQTGRTAGNGAGALQVIWTVLTNNNSDVFTANISSGNVAGPNRPLSVGAPSQMRPNVATSGSGYMVVYRSSTDARSRVLAQPLDAAGNSLTAEPVQLDAGSSFNGPGSPSVAWNGSLYLVSWGATNGIVAQRLQPNGTKIDAAPFMAMSGCFGPTDVAALGNDFLVTGRKVGIEHPVHRPGRRARQRCGRGPGRLAAVPWPILCGQCAGGGAVGSRWLAAWHRNATHDNWYLHRAAYRHVDSTAAR